MKTLKTLTVLITLFLISFLQSQAQDGWGEVQKVTAIERYASQKLGSDIDMDGDYAVSGSDYLNDAYVFEKDSDGNWFQAQHLVSPDDYYNDLFGNAVAISGNTILIGARSHDYDSNNANNMSGAGAVYVFQRDNLGVWNYVQKITPDDRTVGNGFGHVLDIDGDRAVVGVWAQSTDENGENALVSAGAAYIFERNNSGTWAQAQKIVASDRATHDNFGRNGLSISGDYAVVGAQYEDQNELGLDTLSSAGSAYIFKRNSNGDWNEVQKVVASDREQGEWFGHAIAIDGSQMVIASNQAGIQPSNDNNTKRGAAYAFELNENEIWVETQIITASDAKGFDEFGSSIALDGNTIIVGVPGRNYTFTGVHHPDMGAAYVYERDNAGVWNQVQRMQGLDSGQGDNFGYSVALSGDLAMAGAYMQNFDENGTNNISDAGAIYVFDELAEPLVSPYECPYLEANLGDSCDDGDPTTSNDVITADCECTGTMIYDCPALSANIGDSCNDGDENTVGDAINSDCECLGTLTYDCPDLQANIGESCDDNNANTENDVITEDCECAGTMIYDCPALTANIGDSCDDGDENTVGDAINSDCECVGTLTYDCEDLQANIGESCDDNNANTENDVITEDCECVGTVIYDCEDLQANIGESCDDNNSNTENDVITEDCECAGTVIYDCPSLSANIGDSCDDGDENTVGDAINSNCQCLGTLTYDCEDLQANIGESCDDNNANTENDVITEDCECAGTMIYDCPALSANIGDICDDGDENTVGDAINSDCECHGTLTYDCEDLQANIGESCDDNNANTENDVVTEDCECTGTMIYDCPAFSANIGDSCDDGDENTVGDAINSDCECHGTLTYDCQNLQANIGESCDDNDPNTENDVITEECECTGVIVPPTNCEDFVYYLADFFPGTGTNIYEVTLGQGTATLEYLTNVNDEVHLAYNSDNNTLYAVSKALNQYSTLNPHSENPFAGAPVYLPGNYGQLTGAAFAPNGELYISSQSTNKIHSISVFTNAVTEVDAFSPITGGDIAFDSYGNLYLATNANGGGLYQAYPSDDMPDAFLAELEDKSTGLAITASNKLIRSGFGETSLSVRNTNGTTVSESYALQLNGSPFTMHYGDMASGCNTSEPTIVGPCLAVRTFYAQLDVDGLSTDFYEVAFSGSNAALTHLGTVPFNASIGYNHADQALYLVSKSGSLLLTYDLVNESFLDEVMLNMSLYSVTAATYHPEEQVLYVGDANTNSVYAVNPATGDTEFSYSVEVAGGDLVVLYDETLFLATQSGNSLYSLYENNVDFAGSTPSFITGAARGVGSEAIMLSAYQSTVFTEINTFDGGVIAAYEVTQFGLPFTLGYGDMAGGCIDYITENRPEMAVNTMTNEAEVKSILTSSPNPTSGQSQIVFATAETGKTLVEVYDMNGRIVATLFNQQAQAGEEYRLDFDGSHLPNGIYVYKLTTNKETRMTKLMIAR